MLLTCNGPNNSTDRNRIGLCARAIRDRIRMSRIEGVSGRRDVSDAARPSWGDGLFFCRNFRTNEDGPFLLIPKRRYRPFCTPSCDRLRFHAHLYDLFGGSSLFGGQDGERQRYARVGRKVRDANRRLLR